MNSSFSDYKPYWRIHLSVAALQILAGTWGVLTRFHFNSAYAFFVPVAFVTPVGFVFGFMWHRRALNQPIKLPFWYRVGRMVRCLRVNRDDTPTDQLQSKEPEYRAPYKMYHQYEVTLGSVINVAVGMIVAILLPISVYILLWPQVSYDRYYFSRISNLQPENIVGIDLIPPDPEPVILIKDPIEIRDFLLCFKQVEEVPREIELNHDHHMKQTFDVAVVEKSTRVTRLIAKYYLNPDFIKLYGVQDGGVTSEFYAPGLLDWWERVAKP